MSDQVHDIHDHLDVAPGDEEETRIGPRLLGYVVGLGLAILLTATSFFVAGTDLVWQPSIPVAIIVLAIAQMGVHLVFFLHITTGADNTNNVLALAVLAIAQMGVHLVFFLHVTSGPDNVNNVMALGFGVLIVSLIIGGSLFIMHAMNQNMGMHGMSM